MRRSIRQDGIRFISISLVLSLLSNSIGAEVFTPARLPGRSIPSVFLNRINEQTLASVMVLARESSMATTAVQEQHHRFSVVATTYREPSVLGKIGGLIRRPTTFVKRHAVSLGSIIGIAVALYAVTLGFGPQALLSPVLRQWFSPLQHYVFPMLMAVGVGAVHNFVLRIKNTPEVGTVSATKLPPVYLWSGKKRLRKWITDYSKELGVENPSELGINIENASLGELRVYFDRIRALDEKAFTDSQGQEGHGKDVLGLGMIVLPSWYTKASWFMKVPLALPLVFSLSYHVLHSFFYGKFQVPMNYQWFAAGRVHISDQNQFRTLLTLTGQEVQARSPSIIDTASSILRYALKKTVVLDSQGAFMISRLPMTVLNMTLPLLLTAHWTGVAFLGHGAVAAAFHWISGSNLSVAFLLTGFLMAVALNAGTMFRNYVKAQAVRDPRVNLFPEMLQALNPAGLQVFLSQIQGRLKTEQELDEVSRRLRFMHAQGHFHSLGLVNRWPNHSEQVFVETLIANFEMTERSRLTGRVVLSVGAFGFDLAAARRAQRSLFGGFRGAYAKSAGSVFLMIVTAGTLGLWQQLLANRKITHLGPWMFDPVFTKLHLAHGRSIRNSMIGRATMTGEVNIASMGGHAMGGLVEGVVLASEAYALTELNVALGSLGNELRGWVSPVTVHAAAAQEQRPVEAPKEVPPAPAPSPAKAVAAEAAVAAAVTTFIPVGVLKDIDKDMRSDEALHKQLDDEKAKKSGWRVGWVADYERGTFVDGRLPPTLRPFVERDISTGLSPMKADAARTEARTDRTKEADGLAKSQVERQKIAAAYLEDGEKAQVAAAVQEENTLAVKVQENAGIQKTQGTANPWQAAVADVQVELMGRQAQVNSISRSAQGSLERSANTDLSDPQTPVARGPLDVHALSQFVNPNPEAPKEGALKTYRDPRVQHAVLNLSKALARSEMLIEGNERAWIFKHLLVPPSQVTVRAAPSYSMKFAGLLSKHFLFGAVTPGFDKIPKLSWKEEHAKGEAQKAQAKLPPDDPKKNAELDQREVDKMRDALKDFEQARNATFKDMVSAVHRLKDQEAAVKLANERVAEAQAAATLPSRPAEQAAQDLANFEEAARDLARAEKQFAQAELQLRSEGLGDAEIASALSLQEDGIDAWAGAQTQVIYKAASDELMAKDKKFDHDKKKAEGKQKPTNKDKKKTENEERRAYAEEMSVLQSAAERPLNLPAGVPTPDVTTDTPDKKTADAPSSFSIDGPLKTPPYAALVTGQTSSSPFASTVLDAKGDGTGYRHVALTGNYPLNMAVSMNAKSITTAQGNYKTAYTAAQKEDAQANNNDHAFQIVDAQSSLVLANEQMADLISERALLTQAMANGQGDRVGLHEEASKLDQEIAQVQSDSKQTRLALGDEKVEVDPETGLPKDLQATSFDLSTKEYKLAATTSDMNGQELRQVAIVGDVQPAKNELQDTRNFLYNPWEINVIDPVIKPITRVAWRAVSAILHRHPSDVPDRLKEGELLRAEERMVNVKKAYTAAQETLSKAEAQTKAAEANWHQSVSIQDNLKQAAHDDSSSGLLETSRTALLAHRILLKAQADEKKARRDFHRWDLEKDEYDIELNTASRPVDPTKLDLWNHLSGIWWGTSVPEKPLAVRQNNWLLAVAGENTGDSKVMSSLAAGPAAAFVRDSSVEGSPTLVSRFIGETATGKISLSAIADQRANVAAAVKNAKDVIEARELKDKEPNLAAPGIAARLAHADQLDLLAAQLESLVTQMNDPQKGLKSKPDDEAAFKAHVLRLRMEASSIKVQAQNDADVAELTSEQTKDGLSVPRTVYSVPNPEALAKTLVAKTPKLRLQWLLKIPPINFQWFNMRGDNGLWSRGGSLFSDPVPLNLALPQRTKNAMAHRVEKSDVAALEKTAATHLKDLSRRIADLTAALPSTWQAWQRSKTMEAVFENDALGDDINLPDVVAPAERTAAALQTFAATVGDLNAAQRELEVLVGPDHLSRLETVQVAAQPLTLDTPVLVASDAERAQMRADRQLPRQLFGYANTETIAPLKDLLTTYDLKSSELPAIIELMQSVDLAHPVDNSDLAKVAALRENVDDAAAFMQADNRSDHESTTVVTLAEALHTLLEGDFDTHRRFIDVMTQVHSLQAQGQVWVNAGWVKSMQVWNRWALGVAAKEGHASATVDEMACLTQNDTTLNLVRQLHAAVAPKTDFFEFLQELADQHGNPLANGVPGFRHDPNQVATSLRVALDNVKANQATPQGQTPQDVWTVVRNALVTAAPAPSPAAVTIQATEQALQTITVNSGMWTVGHIVQHLRKVSPKAAEYLDGPLFTPNGAADKFWNAIFETNEKRLRDAKKVIYDNEPLDLSPLWQKILETLNHAVLAPRRSSRQLSVEIAA